MDPRKVDEMEMSKALEILEEQLKSLDARQEELKLQQSKLRVKRYRVRKLIENIRQMELEL